VRRSIFMTVVLAAASALFATQQSVFAQGQQQSIPKVEALPQSPPVLPSINPSGPAGPEPAKPDDADRALPINLATALRLADARPLIIEAARSAVETEYGLYEQARVLWLPSIYLGIDYQRHDGAQQNALDGSPIIGSRNQFLAGGGAQAVFALTDAIYSPLAERQLLRARNIQVQVAKNDALLSVASWPAESLRSAAAWRRKSKSNA